MSEISGFLDLAKQKWAKIVKTNNVSPNDSKENLTYYFDEGYIKGIGKTEGDVFLGPWQLYNKAGRLTGNGVFNSNGNRDGEWVWYNSQGKVRETTQYADGKLYGINIHYYDNGRQKSVSNYKNDNLDGEYLFYNKNGALKQKKILQRW